MPPMIQRRERLVGCEVKLCGKVYDPDEDWVDLILAVEPEQRVILTRVLTNTCLGSLTGVFKEETEIRFMREAIRQDAQLAIDISNAAAKRRYDGQHRQVWLTLGRYKLKGDLNAKISHIIYIIDDIISERGDSMASY
ncbi:hypothetical protein V8E54_011993 [Elaphomyces granulatus]